MQSKQDLRKKLRQQRRAITGKTRSKATITIEKNVLRQLNRGIGKIAFYEAVGSELNLTHCAQRIKRRYPHCDLYVPIYYHFSRRLWWVPYQAKNKRRQKRHSLQSMGQVLVPLLGVDQTGHRLGQGGGYYDANFCRLLLKKHPVKIGVGFACQLLNKPLPAQSHDQRLHQFICEHGTIKFS